MLMMQEEGSSPLVDPQGCFDQVSGFLILSDIETAFSLGKKFGISECDCIQHINEAGRP